MVPLKDSLIDLVCTPRERDRLGRAEPQWTKAVFSAKEAVFKCIYPITAEWLDFQELELSFDVPGGRFGVAEGPALPSVGGIGAVAGTFVRTATHWITGAIVL
jgi:4'-phosphopantetheinyl transferase EntD